uniref:Uncharacterized protein n=1 Tax=Davidia involucrata TaxID=16924 RepID=A0A5B6YHI5_DAVIN
MKKDIVDLLANGLDINAYGRGIHRSLVEERPNRGGVGSEGGETKGGEGREPIFVFCPSIFFFLLMWFGKIWDFLAEFFAYYYYFLLLFYMCVSISIYCICMILYIYSNEAREGDTDRRVSTFVLDSNSTL